MRSLLNRASGQAASDRRYKAAHPEKMAAYRAAHHEEIAASNAAYYAAHREERAAYAAAHRAERAARAHAYYIENRERLGVLNAEWRVANPNSLHASRCRRYGLTPKQYGEMLARQGGLCAGCGEASPTDIDHNHKTGLVRGLLCNGCNTALGRVQDDPRTLQKLIDYLAAQS